MFQEHHLGSWGYYLPFIGWNQKRTESQCYPMTIFNRGTDHYTVEVAVPSDSVWYHIINVHLGEVHKHVESCDSCHGKW